MSSDLEQRLERYLHALPHAGTHATSLARSAVEAATPRPGGMRRRAFIAWVRQPSRVLAALGVIALALILVYAIANIGTRDDRTSPATPTHQASGVVGTDRSPVFAEAAGWLVRSTGRTLPPVAPLAMTTNRASMRLALDRPPAVGKLAPGDVLVWAALYRRELGGQPPPSERRPPRFADATPSPGWEGFDRPGFDLLANIGGDLVEFRIFFGRDQPNSADIANADAALTRLRVDENAIRVSLLEGPQTQREAALARQGWVLTTSLIPDSIRLARESDEGDWLAGRTADGRTCLVVLTTVGPESACADSASVTAYGAIQLAHRRSASSGWLLAGLVPDDIARARIGDDEALVEANVYLLPSSRALPAELYTRSGAGPFAGTDVATSSALRLSVLERPASAKDALPPAVLREPARIRPGIGDPTGARWALATSGGRTFWVASGDSQWLVCLVATPDQTACTGVNGIELYGAAVFPSSSARGSSWWRYFAGIVPDGYETARIDDRLVPITNNVFYFPYPPATMAGKVLVLTGPAGRREVQL